MTIAASVNLTNRERDIATFLSCLMVGTRAENSRWLRVDHARRQPMRAVAALLIARISSVTDERRRADFADADRCM
jgi:hypothetical protein